MKGNLFETEIIVDAVYRKLTTDFDRLGSLYAWNKEINNVMGTGWALFK